MRIDRMSPQSGRMIKEDGTVINWADAFYIDDGKVKLRIATPETTVNWGDIEGTLSDQTDLQNALNDKYDANNPDGFISGVDWDEIGGTQSDVNISGFTNDSGYITGTTWGDITGTLSDQTDLQTALDGKLGTTLTSTNIFVGNSSNLATGVAMSGDATLSNTGALTIANDAVTFAKMQNIATQHLIGRHATGSGDPQQVGIGGGLEFQGANIRRSALTGAITAPAGSNSTSLGSFTKSALSTAVSDGTPLYVGDELEGSNFKAKTFSIPVPASAGQATEFVRISGTNFSANAEMWVTVHNSGFAISKRYFFPVRYLSTNGTWRRALPISNTGAFGGNDFDIDVFGAAVQHNDIRIRRISGSSAGTAHITLMIGSDIPGTTITDLSNSYSGATIAGNYIATSLTMVNEKTGVNTPAPVAMLDIEGTTEQLRIRRSVSNYLSITRNALGRTILQNVGGTEEAISIPGKTALSGEHILQILGDTSSGFSGTNDANAAYLIEQRGTSYGVGGVLTIRTYPGLRFGMQKEGSWNKSSQPATGVGASFVIHTSSGGSNVDEPEFSEKFRLWSSGKLELQGDSIVIKNPKTPSSATDTGETGQICWDDDYIYVCVDTDTWKRTAISTW